MSAAASATPKDAVAATLGDIPAAASHSLPRQHEGAENSGKLQIEELINDERVAKKSVELKTPWANLFKTNRMPSKGLKIPKIVVDTSNVVSIGLEDTTPTDCVWKATLIGYIGGKFPGRQAILDICKTWNVHCAPFFHSSGWIIFKFDNHDDMHKVLCNGPYFVFGRPILLKEVPPFFNFNDKSLSLLPIWIKLPGLPLECWSAVALGKIVSKVGTPIATDQLTAEVAGYSYARILVEVDVAKPLTRSLNIQLPNDETIVQSIEYEFEPRYCTKCRRLGHSLDVCRVGLTAPLKGKEIMEVRPKRGRSQSSRRRGVSRAPMAEAAAETATKPPCSTGTLAVNSAKAAVLSMQLVSSMADGTSALAQHVHPSQGTATDAALVCQFSPPQPKTSAPLPNDPSAGASATAALPAVCLLPKPHVVVPGTSLAPKACNAAAGGDSSVQLTKSAAQQGPLTIAAASDLAHNAASTAVGTSALASEISTSQALEIAPTPAKDYTHKNEF